MGEAGKVVLAAIVECFGAQSTVRSVRQSHRHGPIAIVGRPVRGTLPNRVDDGR